MAVWKIPIADLAAGIAEQRNELLSALTTVVDTCQFVGGPEVAAFEAEMATFLGVGYCVGVNSGTDALVVGLRALGVRAGDEVVVPALSFVATANAVVSAGATPVFADIEPHGFSLDPAWLEACVTSRTRAVIPVHLYGQAAAMTPILERAERCGLAVLEDAAQAAGGSYRGRKLGSVGDAAALSFFPAKTLGAFGDGGMLTTGNAGVAAVARRLGQHGGDDKYRTVEHGYNSRLDGIQAAVLRVRLRRLAHMIEQRQAAAARYDELLADVEGVQRPWRRPDTEHAFGQYTVRVPPERRDAIQARLAAEGIQTVVYYPLPLHRLPAFRRAAATPCLPVAERAAREVLSLPLWPGIPASSQETVALALRCALARAPA